MQIERAVPERRGQSSAPLATEARLLLEREHEVEALETAVAAAARGAGQIVVVEGAPGIGKTSLLAYARAAARRSGLLVLDGRGAELEREFAFGVVRQLLEPAMFSLEKDERAGLFAGAAGLAARLFAPGPAAAPGGPG